jgi:hypothetical protein
LRIRIIFVIMVFGYLRMRLFGYSGIGLFGVSVIRVFGYLVICVFGYSVFQLMAENEVLEAFWGHFLAWARKWVKMGLWRLPGAIS